MNKIPLQEIEPGDVPCDGCTRCCHNAAVKLVEEDAVRRKPKFWVKYLPYKCQPHPYYPGQWMLAKKENSKDCYYLGDDGCTIYDKRPKMCREMDCRVIAMRMSFTQARKTKGFPIEVWNKGRELLKATIKDVG